MMTATLAIAFLAGCGSGSDSADLDDPYAAEFADVRATTDDPMLLKILEDDEITDAEYAQVERAEMDCYADNGLHAWIHDGSMNVDNTTRLPDDQFDKVEQECIGRFSGVVGTLYGQIRQNPKREDISVVILDCLKKFDVVNDTMTIDEFEAVDPNSPPWDPLSGDAFGCENQFAAYEGGQPDLTEPPTWPEGYKF